MSQFTAQDLDYMSRAITLAKRGKYTTTPNPNVGCVIVKDGEIVGEGAHLKAGEGHAEVHALKQAGAKAAGATAYVTLEPCSHYGRTPPCAKGLIDAGVSRVVAAMVDPNPQVAGRGLAMLEAAGIATAFGLLEPQARALNTGFLKRMEYGLPFVTCKLAASVDGKTALNNGQSKWITSAEARLDVQRHRAQSCVVLTGADTVMVDNARLNVREESLQDIDYPQSELRQPIRAIIDSQNRLTPDLALFKITSPVIIFRRTIDNSAQWPHFVEQIVVPEINGKLDLKAVLNKLAEKHCNYVWLEAGATLAGVMHEQGLIDEYIVYLAPKIIGAGKGLFNTTPLSAMSQIPELVFGDVCQVGPDLKLIATKEK
ncbi:bifunctional diaminohydroxyphosphoribosylaminopyrimidine deaminase/5-amino-6-(5-phosphoribosylamino)uracil reductase RibD [Pseudoalteromonas sp. CO342X]|uniref:bifunctional diaminohydroxyphosphoribosylaminopyrimidine deaminase/5-amino-6-(5-phosphoribosylamino)uracil reductase RibD n=1 Tax=Pseudoalteromonas sp. CO342X TaxID=1777270 RepID=UPI0010237460|nr:bifunctional diaminohydroxyphosphoribosylaminopyrimidine deaminase/5-amino-6-(5-phosphoribosylamino)uracil reductase RibD [Pseudoalteromonas sp. CO342X]RZG17503.1 bifunctional diaminohydroxyphosphoribosylaminopyrimidine deaminase/5-amino-6-(5-phosphoribosylamino)uracil reductase RibD [Pseudoalteromonas sp. CO342X]